MLCVCLKCESDFEAEPFRGYCDDCLQSFQEVRKSLARHCRSAPNIHMSGKFTETGSPKTAVNPVTQVEVCGLCGSEDVDTSYGFAGGYGLGSHVVCSGCGAFLNFVEDMGE